MELLLQRADAVIRGGLHVNGKFRWFTLENPALRIKAGTYRVALTRSGRVERGTLWTPDRWREGCLLPEILNVEGRTGIRIHATNEVNQLEGCVAVGVDRLQNTLLHSRLALEALMAELLKDLCYLTIVDPKEA